MAVTINADTSNGVIITPDTSGEIELQANGVTKAKVTANGLQDANGNSLRGGSYRNLIINGNMRIDQRNAGASVTPTDIGGTTYHVDRFLTRQTQASKFSIQQNAGSVTPPVGFTNYLGVTSLSSYSSLSSDLFSIQHRVEGNNIAHLAWGTVNAKTITISFWVRSSLTGTFGGSIQNGSQNRSYPFSYTISSTNTWEKKTITIDGDITGTWVTTNAVAIIVHFNLGTGTNRTGTAGTWAGGNFWNATGATSVVGTSGATFYITGVQLEVGEGASDFEHLPYDVQLQRCQRYFNLQFTYVLGGGVYTQYSYPSKMRTAPTITGFGAGGFVGASSDGFALFQQTSGGTQNMTYSAEL